MIGGEQFGRCRRDEPDRKNRQGLVRKAGLLYPALVFLMKAERCVAVCHR
jgi:hypothetical protein